MPVGLRLFGDYAEIGMILLLRKSVRNAKLKICREGRLYLMQIPVKRSEFSEMNGVPVPM